MNESTSDTQISVVTKYYEINQFYFSIRPLIDLITVNVLSKGEYLSFRTTI